MEFKCEKRCPKSNSAYQDTRNYEIPGASAKTPGRGNPKCGTSSRRSLAWRPDEPRLCFLFDEEIVITS